MAKKDLLGGLVNLAKNIQQTSNISRIRKDGAASKKASIEARKDAAVAREDAGFAKKDAAVARKDAAIAREDAGFAKKDAAVARKDAAVARKDAAVAREDAAVAKEAGIETLAKIDELLKGQLEREEREELERQRAELHARRQEEIKEAVFYLKQELDLLEEQKDRVARVVVLSLLQSEIEEVDMSLDEFESLHDREYAIGALSRLDDMGAETESSLTDTDRKQLVDLDDTLEQVGKKTNHVLEIEGSIKKQESQLTELSERINRQEEDLAHREQKGKNNRNYGSRFIVLALICFLIDRLLDWNTVGSVGTIFAVIGFLRLMFWIFRTPGRILHRNSTMKSMEEARKQWDDIDAELQNLQDKLAMAVKDRGQAEQRLGTIVKDHPELEFLVETDS